MCNRHPHLLLTVDCLFNEGQVLSSKHNKAAHMEIIKLIATSDQGYANKVKMADFLPLSPLNCFCFTLIFFLRTPACFLDITLYGKPWTLSQINSVTLDVNIETTAFLWMLTVFNPCTASNNSNFTIFHFILGVPFHRG